MKIQSASLSDVGRVRKQNEDSLVLLPKNGVYVVADGMGGHAGGKRASQTAVDAIAAHLRDDVTTLGDGSAEPPRTRTGRDQLVAAVHVANHRILDLAAKETALRGMGTTVAALLIEGEGRGAVVHIGDSRIYRLRGDRFEQLTNDHSLVADLLRRGEITPDEARTHPYRHTLTRALGAASEVNPEVRAVDPLPGDLFILCSDGVYGMIDEATLKQIVVAGQTDLDRLCVELVAAANAGGGKDNASVVAVRCLPD